MNRIIGLSGVLPLVACQPAPDQLAPSLDPSGHPLLTELPASAPLLVGGQAAPLLDSPWAGRLALDTQFTATAGVSADAVDHIAGACTDSGCALLATGDTTQLSLAHLQAHHPAAQRHPDRIDARGDDGVRYRLQRAPGRILLGHTGAVERLGAHTEPLDPVDLTGLIPDGDLWLYARDQDALAAQAASWIRHSGSDEMRAQLPELEARFAARPELARAVTDVALSVDAAAVARVRLTCTTEGAAMLLATALRAERRRQQATQPQPIAEAIAQTTLTRVGPQIELTFAPDDALLEELLR